MRKVISYWLDIVQLLAMDALRAVLVVVVTSNHTTHYKKKWFTSENAAYLQITGAMGNKIHILEKFKTYS